MFTTSDGTSVQSAWHFRTLVPPPEHSSVHPARARIVRLAILSMLALAILGVIPTNSPGDEEQKPGEDIPFEDQIWQVPVTLGGDEWMLYKNRRFGFVLPVPPNPLYPRASGGAGAEEIKKRILIS